MICFLYLFRVGVSSGKNKAELLRYGIRLIFYAGLFLASLQLINQSLNFLSTDEILCNELLEKKRYYDLAELGCEFNYNFNLEIIKSIFESTIFAFSWLAPFMFASVGVNVISQGILMERTKNEFTEKQLANRLPAPLRRATLWLLRQFP
jgi:hypothetical protein